MPPRSSGLQRKLDGALGELHDLAQTLGVGTVLSMAIITIFLSLPFVLSVGVGTLHRTVVSAAGAISLIIGFALIAEISVGVSIIPF